VMLYVRFPLSLRNVEDLLHERGIDVSHETIRFWWQLYFSQAARSGSPACWRPWHSTRRGAYGLLQ
jgi:transposase-like protein